MSDTRDRLVQVSAALLQRQGLTGTGIKQILAEAHAPFSSLYHHFPGGKDELAAAAIGDVGRPVPGAGRGGLGRGPRRDQQRRRCLRRRGARPWGKPTSPSACPDRHGRARSCEHQRATPPGHRRGLRHLDRRRHGALRDREHLRRRRPPPRPHSDLAPRRGIRPQPSVEEHRAHACCRRERHGALCRACSARPTGGDRSAMADHGAPPARPALPRRMLPGDTRWRRSWTRPALAELAEFGKEEVGQRRRHPVPGRVTRPTTSSWCWKGGPRSFARDLDSEADHRHATAPGGFLGELSLLTGQRPLLHGAGHRARARPAGAARRFSTAHERQARHRRSDLQRLLGPPRTSPPG